MYQNLHMGTLKLPQQSPIVGEDDHVKLVTMRISDQNIPSICRDKVICYDRNVLVSNHLICRYRSESL